MIYQKINGGFLVWLASHKLQECLSPMMTQDTISRTHAIEAF
jgi:hypothetical protein